MLYKYNEQDVFVYIHVNILHQVVGQIEYGSVKEDGREGERK